MRILSSLLAAVQLPYLAPSAPANGLQYAAGGIDRDFARYPLKIHLHGASLPAQVAVLPDVHAAANRLFPLLLNNGIVQRRPEGPQPSEHCGTLDSANWGAFRWDNPYVWSFGNKTVVSLGDRIDKGPFNLVTECFFRDLEAQAERDGGRSIALWGNHETQAGAEWDNVKTRGPGGVLYELYAYGIDPARWFGKDGAYGARLGRLPLMAQLGDDVELVHGGLCPSSKSLHQQLQAIERGIRKDGLGTEALQNENSPTRCRIQAGHKGRLTRGNTTEVTYAHDPEHEPRGEPYCFEVVHDGQKPLTYCRTDVGMTPYINYSLGWLLRYDRAGAGFTRQSCNELGACSPLAASPTGPPASASALRFFDRRPSPLRITAGPGRGPHRGLDRNFTAYPAVAVVPDAQGPLFVLAEPLGALLPLKKQLVALGLLADGPLLSAPQWTGANAVLVVPGNLFGQGYFNLETMQLLQDLEAQAESQNGRVISLLGAYEVDFLCEPNNDQTWDGGGLATQLTGSDVWPEDFAKDTNPLYFWMQNRPLAARIFDLFLLSGGQTSNRHWKAFGADAATAIQKESFCASFISGDNSAMKKIDFAGKDGHQGPLLALDAGVTTIVHALNLQQAPVDDIKPYGRRKEGSFSLYNVATRLNPVLGGGEGKALRVRRRKDDTMDFDAIDSHGRRTSLERRPRNAKLSV